MLDMRREILDLRQWTCVRPSGRSERGFFWFRTLMLKLVPRPMP